MRFIRLIPLLLVLSLAVGCFDNAREPIDEPTLQPVTTTVAALRNIASSKQRRITEPMVVGGRVTTSDEEGNFYRSFFFEDATGGAELLAGTFDLHATYPQGVEVSVSLQGCAVMLDNGVLKVGLPTGSYDYEPAEFQSPALLKAHVGRGTTIVAPQPQRYAVEELNDRLCGMYVEIVGLHHVPTVDDEVTMAGYRCFEDVLRQRIYCYTNEYATFAAQPVPEGEISLRGILSYENVGNNSGRQWVVTPVAWNDVVVCSLSAHADIMP